VKPGEAGLHIKPEQKLGKFNTFTEIFDNYSASISRINSKNTKKWFSYFGAYPKHTINLLELR